MWYNCDKQYDAAYRNQGKPIILLGIAFDQASYNLIDWAVERIEAGQDNG